MAFFVAFYSYKGGVGRTLALANAAYALAARGKRVVLVDLDLEAPGLQEYKEFAIRGKSPKGFLEYAAHYRQTGKCPALKSHVHACKDSPGTGKLWLMPSGAISGSYQKQLGDLSWRKLHPQKGTTPFLETFRKALDDELQPDYVLIDSRTGLSDIGGLTTHQLADLVVLVFNLTRSCLEGSVRTYRSFVSKTSKARFLQLVASPVPPLAPSPNSIVERRLAYAREHMPLGVAYGRTILRIDYNPAMALTEELAVRHPEAFPAAERYEALREAIQRVNPDEVFTILERARELRSAGRLDDGLALLREFTRMNPGNSEGHLESGNFLFEAGRTQEAIPEFQKASELAPFLALPHRRLGEALVATRQSSKAIEALKRAEELGEKGRETYMAFVRAYEIQGDLVREAEARQSAINALMRETPSLNITELSLQLQTPELRQIFVDLLSRRPPFSGFQPEAFWQIVLESFVLSPQGKETVLKALIYGMMLPSEVQDIWRILEEDHRRWEKVLGPSVTDLRKHLACTTLDPSHPEQMLQLRNGTRSDASLLIFVALQGKLSLEENIDLVEQAVETAPEDPHILMAAGAALGLYSGTESGTTRRALLERSSELISRSIPLREGPAPFLDLISALSRLAHLSQGQEREHFWSLVAENARKASQLQPGAGDYNLACALSQLAQIDEAGELMITDLERRPSMRAHALEDPDLAPLWEARPDLRASIAAALPPPTPPGS